MCLRRIRGYKLCIADMWKSKGSQCHEIGVFVDVVVGQ
jgi:hypothetical protein